MGFLLIPESICLNVNLTATAKMVLSYVKHLSKKGKSFYGSLEYLSTELGLEKKMIYKSLQGLEQAGLIIRNSEGYFCDLTDDEILMWRPSMDAGLEKIAKTLASNLRYKDGTCGISERNTKREAGGHGVCEK